MKKNKMNIRLIIFIVIAILVLALVILGIVKLVKSKSDSSGYKELTAEEYVKIVENNKYTINDITETMSSYNYIQNAIMAVSENKEYQIEYYMFTDVTSAYNFFSNKKTAISMVFGPDDAVDESETDEYSKYSVSSDKLYCTVFRIGESVVCVDAKAEYKNEIDNMLKKLGYIVK